MSESANSPDVSGQIRSEELHGRVMDALEEILDPCSCQTNRPVSIVDLGLVENVETDPVDGIVHVDLLLTSQMCMYFPNIQQEIELEVGEIEGVDTVEVEQVTDEIWTPERISEDEQAARDVYFQKEVEKHDITPWAEREN